MHVRMQVFRDIAKFQVLDSSKSSEVTTSLCSRC